MATAPRYDILVTGSNLRLKDDFLGISSIVLVRSGDRKILLDVGGYTTRFGMLKALEQRGLGPDDIDLVFLSHLHFDHSHNIDLFPEAKVLVSRREWDYARAPHENDRLMPWGIHAELEKHDLELVDGEGELGPGLTFFPAPGHTPGLYALRLETPDHGTVILAADAIKYAKEALLARCDLAFDAPETGTATIEAILAVAERIVPGHFPELVRRGDTFVWEDETEFALIVR
jgi:N-acyl homoserine lactone hydrolase